MKQQSLLKNTIFLTISALLARTIGMISLVFLSQIIGSFGLGIYQIAMTIYMTAVVFVSAGISTTVSRMVAEEIGKQQLENIPSIMYVCLTFAISCGLMVGCGLFILTPWFTRYIIHDETVTTALRLLSFSLPFIGCSSCLKGYFYAHQKAIYPASSDILEQVIKLLLIVVLVKAYATSGTSSTYAAIGLGLTIGEVISWSYLFSLFLVEVRRSLKRQSPLKHALLPMRQTFTQFISILLPIAMVYYIGYIFLSVENILIPAGLKKYGESFSSSMSLYGILKGMVLPILFFPSAFLTAFSTTLIPEIAKANVLHQMRRVATTTHRVLQLTSMLSLIIVAIFFNYGDELGFIIYKSEAIGPMLKCLAIIIPFSYTEVICDGILKGLNQQVSCMKYSLLDTFCRILLIYLLLPIRGIQSLMAIMIISSIFTSTLNFNKLYHTVPLKLQPINYLIKPTIAAGFASSYSRLIVSYLFRYSLGLTTKVFLGISLTFMMYIPLLLLIRSISFEDLAWLKKHLASFHIKHNFS